MKKVLTKRNRYDIIKEMKNTSLLLLCKGGEKIMDAWEYNWWDDRTVEQNETNFCPVLNDFCYEGNDACKDCVTLKAFKEYYDRRPKE